jgi:branched-chain amino acid transport system ATP-binding protein
MSASLGVPAGALLEVKDLHAAYGLSRVLFGISLEVQRGECVCLLGRNGVGKSTTLRAIMGLTPPSAGTVRWQGKDVTGWPPNRAARAGVGFVPEDRRIFAELTVWENLELADRAGGKLSGGEQQMLTIARTLMGNPELLLLDEPSEGLAPLVVEHLLEQVTRLKQDGLTIMLAEQGVEFSLALADRVYVLEKGAVRFSGPASQLRDDAALRNELLAL